MRPVPCPPLVWRGPSCSIGVHGPLVACDRMGLDTDGRGFPHPQTLKGRRASRHCQSCGVLVHRPGDGSPEGLWRSIVVGKLQVPVTIHCPACHKIQDR